MVECCTMNVLFCVCLSSYLVPDLINDYHSDYHSEQVTVRGWGWMGGSPCRMSIIRNGNVALSILRNGNVALSNLRNGNDALSILRNCNVACR